MHISVVVCELMGGILFVLRRSYPCSRVSCCVYAKGWCLGYATWKACVPSRHLRHQLLQEPLMQQLPSALCAAGLGGLFPRG